MGKKVIVFGVKDTAELADYYLSEDTSHQVVAFTVSNSLIPKGASFIGKPVVPWEELELAYTPNEYSLFIPMTGRKMNKIRSSFYSEGKRKGYSYISYVSSRATIYNTDIGENCFILEDNTIQPFTKIGNNVVLWSGNHIGHHSTIEDHSFLTSQVVLSGHSTVGPYCWFGVNSTIIDGLTLNQGTFVAASSLITKDTTPWRAYKGVPGKEYEDSMKVNP